MFQKDKSRRNIMILNEYKPTQKIRRGGKIIQFATATIPVSFRKYGLNIHKNLMRPIKFKGYESGSNDEDNEFSVKVTDMLLHLLDLPWVMSAAIFVVKLNGQKLIYQIDMDCHFEDGEFVEDDPYVSFYRISDDTMDQCFSVFDAENDYDTYGLIVEVEDNVWQIIDE